MRKIRNPWIHKEGYNCFGCSPSNEHGLKMEFFEEGEEVVSHWRPQADFQGWINTLHGGVQAVLLDEISAWVILRKLQTTGVTSKMELKYVKPVSTLQSYLTLRAHIVEQKRNIVMVEASLYDEEDQLCTQARCTYFTFPKAKAEEMGFSSCDLEDDVLLF